jgi:hypothetical protein
MKRARTVLLMLALAGSAGAAGFTEAPPPPAGKALVYIYRAYNYQQGNQGAAIYLDGKQAVNLGTRGCTWLHLPEGMHMLEHRKDVYMAEERTGAEIRFASGRTYYFRVSVAVGAGIKDVRWTIAEQPPGKALEEMARCRYQKPKAAFRGDGAPPQPS